MSVKYIYALNGYIIKEIKIIDNDFGQQLAS